jgi:hypothetical protein
MEQEMEREEVAFVVYTGSGLASTTDKTEKPGIKLWAGNMSSMLPMLAQQGMV